MHLLHASVTRDFRGADVDGPELALGADDIGAGSEPIRSETEPDGDNGAALSTLGNLLWLDEER